MRRTLGLRAVGHTGTLDPVASGLLVVLVGRATRLARFVAREAKGYWAQVQLGVTTDTDDCTGTVVAEVRPARWPDEAAIRAALAGFVGTFPQRPPAYSARKVSGRRAYRWAREGAAVTPAPRPVTVHALELDAWEPPCLTLRAAVSAGTYVRALARDLGERLELGAHVRALRREWIGPHHLAQAVALEALEPERPLVPPLDLVPGLPRVTLSAEEARAVAHGREVARPDAAGEGALVYQDRLVAVAAGGPGGVWAPLVVLEPA